MNDLLKESVDYLNQYATVTDEVIEKIQSHVKQFELTEEICAWYKNMDDFYSDWHEHVGLTKEETKKRFNDGKENGEFQVIKEFGIIRYTM